MTEESHRKEVREKLDNKPFNDAIERLKLVFENQMIDLLARDLHEAGREAVEKGKTVALEKGLHKPFPFIEWDDLGPDAKEGRLIQARYLRSRWEMKPRFAFGGEE